MRKQWRRIGKKKRKEKRRGIKEGRRGIEERGEEREENRKYVAKDAPPSPLRTHSLAKS